jgi:MFS family permease
LVGVVTQLKLQTPPPARRFDLAGAATLTGALTLLLLVSVYGGSEYSWRSPQIVGLGLGALALVIAFVLAEQRAEDPIVPLELFGQSIVPVTTVTAALADALVLITIVYATLFAQGVMGVSATAAGVLMLPLNFTFIAGSVLAGRLIHRTGRYRIFPIVGFVTVVAGTVALARIGIASNALDLVVPTTVMGLGFGLAVPPTVLALQNAVPPRNLGAATATYWLGSSLGGALGLAVFWGDPDEAARGKLAREAGRSR